MTAHLAPTAAADKAGPGDTVVRGGPPTPTYDATNTWPDEDDPTLVQAWLDMYGPDS